MRTRGEAPGGQYIRAGRNLGPNVEVTSSGLTPDLSIVVNPNALLRAGDAVDLAPRNAAKESPPALSRRE